MIELSGLGPVHVSPTLPQRQIRRKDLRITETFGPSGSNSLGPSDLTRCLASRLTTVLPGSTERHLTWSERVLPSGRSIFRLVPSMRPTNECELTLWPTPTVQDSSNKAGPSQWVRNSWALNVQVVAHSLGVTSRPENLDDIGALAPEFACWLMGYPVEWDDCAPMGTRLSPKQQQPSSDPIEKSVV
jgi:hypothetical protein